MKIRTDFVSNSSSCSFTVSNVSKLMELMIPIGEMPYNYDEFTFYVTCKQKDFDTLYEAYHNEKYHPTYGWAWGNSKPEKPDPESTCRFDFDNYNRFIEIWPDLPDSVKSNLTEFEISCHNYDAGHVGLLNMLFDLFSEAGLNPDNSYSETGFRPGERYGDSFLGNLSLKMKELRDKNNGIHTKKSSR